MIIQVYAFTVIEEAVKAAELGVDHIGFVAGTYDLVPGELSFTQARALRDALPSNTTAVALTMATEIDEILRMVDAIHPDILHISTDVEDVPERSMEALKVALPSSVRLMKALPVVGRESLDLARRFAPVSDLYLLDTKMKGMPGVGATGHTHDWTVSQKIVEALNTPVILAGGLDPENVQEAIRVVKPWGVDSNTHTNLPGDSVKKDMARIAAFVAAVKGREG
jgi:phosphoribosylanthranilate isomerase